MKKFFVVCISVFALTTCKKYEEGPFVSFRSAEERVANDWRIEKYYDDGVEQSLSDEDKNTKYTFTKDGKLTIIVPSQLGNLTINGNWYFTDSKKKLVMAINFLGNTETYTYKILKLKENEMWLKDEEENDEIHFIPYNK